VSQGVQTAASPAEVSFEEALRKLESIVEAMESDELPLDQLIQRFEEGAALARLCQDRLGEAEGKVRRLEENLDGTLSTRPMGDEGAGAA
jgi:exodeoxyribonuclease VII small subunit